jgi:LETM1 and EF-hand domain-containing protein 1, mitochondrial
MITQMDVALANMEKQTAKKKASINGIENDATKVQEEELVHINDLMNAIKKIKNVPDNSKVKQIQNILGQLDDDFDGQLKVDDVFKVNFIFN